MKFEIGSLNCEMKQQRDVSNFTLHPLNFYLAATIKSNFEELGI